MIQSINFLSHCNNFNSKKVNIFFLQLRFGLFIKIMNTTTYQLFDLKHREIVYLWNVAVEFQYHDEHTQYYIDIHHSWMMDNLSVVDKLHHMILIWVAMYQILQLLNMFALDDVHHLQFVRNDIHKFYFFYLFFLFDLIFVMLFNWNWSGKKAFIFLCSHYHKHEKLLMSYWSHFCSRIHNLQNLQGEHR